MAPIRIKESYRSGGNYSGSYGGNDDIGNNKNKEGELRHQNYSRNGLGVSIDMKNHRNIGCGAKMDVIGEIQRSSDNHYHYYSSHKQQMNNSTYRSTDSRLSDSNSKIDRTYNKKILDYQPRDSNNIGTNYSNTFNSNQSSQPLQSGSKYKTKPYSHKVNHNLQRQSVHNHQNQKFITPEKFASSSVVGISLGIGDSTNGCGKKDSLYNSENQCGN